MMVPFDSDKLNTLMDEAGLDLLLVTTRHNIRYLTGGYHNHYHARMERMGVTRYLTVLGLPKGRLDQAFFITGYEEAAAVQWHKLWVAHHYQTKEGRTTYFQDSLTAARTAVEVVRSLGFAAARIGVELPFLPAESFLMWQREFPQATFLDATSLLGELRAVKSQAELELIRSNAERTAAAIQATFTSGAPGATTAELAARLQTEMMQRGIEMQWVLIAMGPDGVGRKWPSERAWQPGEVLRIDSGGGLNDYLVDLCRMGCLGEPSPLASELHANCLLVNDTLLRVIKPGMTCAELYTLGQNTLKQTSHTKVGFHVTHGVGLVTHEPPQIVPHSHWPLEAGMVMSLETQFQHPEVGDVKIEDAVVVTATGCEPLGHTGREWQLV